MNYLENLNIYKITAFLTTLYFIEIILLLFKLLIFYGKTFSSIIGLTLSVLLTVHIINLNNKKHLNKKIQLLLSTFYSPIIIIFIFNWFYYINQITLLNTISLFYKSFLLFINITTIILFTRKKKVLLSNNIIILS